MKLVTHNGAFHLDEVLATSVLLEIYPDAEIVRSRDMDIIDSGDVVYDVGSIFDPEKNRFDHHQRGFYETFSPDYKIKLSSAGLVFKYFHEKLFAKYGLLKSSPIFDDIKKKIYEEIFLYADAIDNGIDTLCEIKPRSLADVVRSFNCRSIVGDNDEASNARFFEALEFVKKDLNNYLNHVLTDYRVNYEKLFDELKNFDDEIFITSRIYSLDLIFTLNKRLSKDIKHVIYTDDTTFRIYVMPIELGKFAIKYPLHADWRGLRDEELVKISEIPGCTFVHASGFTGGNLSLDGAIKMCKKSLEKLNCDI